MDVYNNPSTGATSYGCIRQTYPQLRTVKSSDCLKVLPKQTLIQNNNKNCLVRAKSWRPSTDYVHPKDLETDISLSMTDTESKFETNKKSQTIKLMMFREAAE